MNNGKICVSVCAETADEMLEQIKRAGDLADVIEIRFDCLAENEIGKFYATLDRNWKISDIPLISTFRPKQQGGKRELTWKERQDFWNSGNEIGWADCEEDFIEDSFSWLWEERICSYHDFETTPENLSTIYRRLKNTEADITKIAVQANDITDAIPIWKLLERAKSENKQIIPIAMGEAGKWTRILGLAHGAFMTYASLDSGKETAPGQVSVKDLTDVYRVKELDAQTDIYGIVGGNTSYSMSPYLHNAAFKFHNLNAVYVPFEVKNLDDFINIFLKDAGLNIKGFSVTNPHKQSIIKYLDDLDETAKAIGAVNTVKIIDGELFGYNTDADGFIEPLKNAYGDLRDAKVAVLGAGGAARACVYALTRENADVTVFARDVKKTAGFQVSSSRFKVEGEDYSEFDILVNTTPLGTSGELEEETIAVAEQIKDVNLIYDLVYNPFQTSLMAEADRVHVPKIGGLAMLVAQGMKQFEIWTGKDAPMKEMSAAVLRRLQ